MTENIFQIFIIIVDIKDNFEKAEILIENDLMEYKNKYFFESVKIIASNINISHKKITDTKWYLLFFGARDGT